MENLAPYLMFDGNCEEAMNFYKDCFKGEITYLGRYADSPLKVSEQQKDKVMHTTLNFWGGTIMASDSMENADYTIKPEGSNIHLSLGFTSNEKLERTFNKLKEGGTITMPLQEQFWGDKFGQLKDRFGIHWMFSCPKPNNKK